MSFRGSPQTIHRVKDGHRHRDRLIDLSPTVVLGQAAIALSLFGLALALRHWNTVNAEGFATVQSWTRAVPDTAWSMVTICGIGIAGYALLSPTLAWQPRWMAAGLAAAPLAGAYSRLLKSLYALPRPAGVLDPADIHVIGETLRTNSFPSGHTVTASTLAAVLVLASRSPRVTLAWVVPAALLIAISRVAVGAHWPADLAAGAAGGWVAGTVGVAVARRWRIWNTVQGIRIMAAVVVGIGGSLYFADLGHPSALPLQYALGLLAIASGTIAALRPRLDPFLPYPGRSNGSSLCMGPKASMSRDGR